MHSNKKSGLGESEGEYNWWNIGCIALGLMG